VLGATTSQEQTAQTRSNAGLLKVVKPFADISLSVVKGIDPQKYEQIVGETAATAQVIPGQITQVTNTTVVKNLNAKRVQGLEPGTGEGNLVTFSQGKTVPGLQITNENFSPDSINGNLLQNGT